MLHCVSNKYATKFFTGFKGKVEKKDVYKDWLLMIKNILSRQNKHLNNFLSKTDIVIYHMSFYEMSFYDIVIYRVSHETWH